MCRRIDSIVAVGRAADHLTAVCQAQLEDAPEAQAIPRRRMARSLRKAFHVPYTTPDDIDALIRRIK